MGPVNHPDPTASTAETDPRQFSGQVQFPMYSLRDMNARVVDEAERGLACGMCNQCTGT